MDRTGADFYFVLDTIRERLGCKAAVVQLPIGSEAEFAGVVDLLEMNALIWTSDDLGASWNVVEIPADMIDKADEYRHELVDVLSEFDENILEKYVGGEDISADDLRSALRTGTLSGLCVPILTGSAFKNKGVQPLLDAVVEYLPSPMDLPPVEGVHPRSGDTIERAADDGDPFAALAFKIMTDPHVGKLIYFRVYSGSLDKGSAVLNTRSGNKERIGRILEMHANNREDRDEVRTGDIVAGIGLKNTRTGDTLCSPDHPIVLEQLEFPEPVIHVAVEPRSKADQDKMSKALGALAEEDPTFSVRSDEETGQTIIGGMGELHLEVLVDRMLREFSVDANVGRPQVAYRETITRTVVDLRYTHKKQTGGRASSPRSWRPSNPTPTRTRPTTSRTTSGWPHSEGVHPGSRPGHPGGDDQRRARRLQRARHQGHPQRRQVARRGLLGDGVQDRRTGLVPRCHRQGGARGSSNRSVSVEVVTPETTWATLSAT